MTEPVTLPVDTASAAAAPPPPRVRAVPAALVSVALLATNALAYGFTLLATRLMSPAAYGELAALMGVLLVGVVPSTGLQTAAALYLGRPGADRARDIPRLHAVALLTSLGTATVGLLAAGPVVALLHLRGPAAAVWLVLLLVPHTLIGGYQGILQGAERYGRLALLTAGFGLAKVVGAAAGLLLGGTPAAALAGMAAGTALGTVLGWLGSGRPGVHRGGWESGRAVLRASGALLGFVVLLNLDLVLARHYLPAAAAGEYAVATLFAKVAFWLPQGVGVVLLPRLADPAQRRRTLPSALALVAAVGAVLTAGTAALGTSALPLVGGAAYGAQLGSASWLFAVLGTLLALAQLTVYSGIAAADRIAVGSGWAAAALECVIVAGLAASGRLTVLTLVGTAVVVGTLVVGGGLLRSLPRARERGNGILRAE